jgi:hypothetical protein
MEQLKQWYPTESIPVLVIFLLFCLTAIGVAEHQFVITEPVIYQYIDDNFGGLVSGQGLAKMVRQREKVEMFKYPIHALLSMLGIAFYAVTIQPLVASPLYAPKVPLLPIVRVLLISHLATVGFLVAKVLYFWFFVDKVTLAEYEMFYPLSLANVVDYRGWPAWAVGLLRNFNLFEAWFTLSLGYGLGAALQNPRAGWAGGLVNLVMLVLSAPVAGLVGAGR